MNSHGFCGVSVVILLVSGWAVGLGGCGDGSSAQNTLHDAAQRGSTDQVELMLGQGVDVNLQRVQDDATALHVAAALGHGSVVELILQRGGDVHAKAVGGKTPLVLAVSNGHADVVQLLLEHEADPNVATNDGMKPLHMAILGGYVEVIEVLLSHGVDIANVSSGPPPLHVAATRGEIAIIELFIKHGVDVNMKTELGFTPLHWAAEQGKKQAVQMLLENGAEIDAESEEYHWTPLGRAVFGGHVEMVKILIEKGANVDHKTTSNMTPLYQASLNRGTAMTNGNGPAAARFADMIALLLENGADANVTCDDVNKTTPLLRAAQLGDIRVAEWLLEKEVDVDALDAQGISALLWAVGFKHVKMVELLLAKGADINIKAIDSDTKQLITPLNMAIKGGNEDMIQMLRDQGAEEPQSTVEPQQPADETTQETGEKPDAGTDPSPVSPPSTSDE